MMNSGAAVVSFVLLTVALSAQEPVEFADPKLKAAVETRLGVSDPTPGDMLGLTFLSANNEGIVNLAGLESATSLTSLYLGGNQLSDLSALSALRRLEYLSLSGNQLSDLSALLALTRLKYLYLRGNQLSDLSALSGLRSLTSLYLRGNQLSDLSALSGLRSLGWLDLRGNQISDISALSATRSLTSLYLGGNQISDISALSALTRLGWLDLRGNPLDCFAYCSVIPAIREKNPSISIFHDPLPDDCELTCDTLMTPPQIAADDLFVRGDSNVDGEVNLTDPVFTLNALFGGGSPLTCHDAADADDNGSVQLTDAVFTLNFLFLSGERSPFPFPHCGADQTEDTIDCESFPACTPTFSFFSKEFSGDGVFFVTDRSGSMQNSGELQRVKEEFGRSLTELPDGSQFGIVFLDRGIIRFPEDGRPAQTSQESIAEAIEWINAVPGGGGSCFREGMLAALEFVDFSTARRNVVIYAGDGGGTCNGANERTHIEATLRDTTEANNARAQINTFGIGLIGNLRKSALIQLAELNGGIYTHVDL